MGIGVKAFNESQIELNDDIELADDAFSEEYDDLAYIDDGHRKEVGKMLKEALSQFGETLELYTGRYTFLAEIDFKTLSERFDAYENGLMTEAVQARRAYRQTNEVKLSFFSTYVIPVLRRRFVRVDGNLFFRTNYACWIKCDPTCKTSEIVELICFMVPQMNVTRCTPVQKTFIEMFDKVVDSGVALTGDTLIQFNDCVFMPEHGLTQRQDFGFPRYFFDREMWHLMEKGKPTKAVPEVDDLLMHLANGDKEVRDCLVSRLAMAFITSVAKKRQLEAKAVMLYGPTGENGKSTLAALLRRAFRYENVGSFNFASFERYAIAEAKNNLLLIDEDASSVHVSADVVASLKKCVTSDTMLMRQIYRSPESVTPFTQFLVCTNAMPKAEDKTRGWDRRLEWFEIREKLVRPNEWFRRLESNEAADYLFELLLFEAHRLTKLTESIKVPDALVESNKVYRDANRNVTAWMSAMELEKGASTVDCLDRRPAGLVYSDYESWCRENAETPLGRNNFNSILAAETGMVSKSVKLKPATDHEAFAWWQQQKDTDKRLTATEAVVKCWARP